ncbi:MAG: LysM domain-containing protein [Bacillota bacterium]|uniref:LysM peptidoglycan-binding domain-containing protein n=1 Tax=Desulforudis sp. DRI-14 TaxID=3459793 RepID=UPI00346D91BC
MDHVVKPGETLSDICKRYNVSVEEVLQLNRHIEDPDNLRQGQVVTLPPPTVIVEPEVRRFIPAGARVVVVRQVRFTRRFPPERAIIVQLRDGLFAIIIIRFIPGVGFRVVFQRSNIVLPIQILESGTLLGDDREQVVVGATTGVDSALSFSVLGAQDDDIVELISRLDDRVPQGRVSIHEGRLEVSSPTQIRRFTWDGSKFVETAIR